MAVGQTLKTNRELDVARTDDVLDLELGELGVEPELLHDPRVLAGSETRVVLRLRARDDHLARREDQSGRLWVANTHDDGGETLNAKNEGSSIFMQATVSQT